jgi:D-alanyl-lipoteichoic acid acyltransferase DltB (MBOAT superfamily)
MARGLGLTLGFTLMVNFNLPFWATNVQDFWNNWHISLSSWVRDYIYFPLMGALRKIKGNARIYAAVVISFTLMGLWHGAAWNFVVFGLYYGVLTVILIIMRIRFARFAAPASDQGQPLWYFLRLIFMFNLTASAMLFFHASSLANAGEILSRITASTSTELPRWAPWEKLLGFSLPVILMEYAELRTKDLFFVLNKMPWLTRIALLAFLTYLILGWGVMTAEEFIYFQF